MAIADKIAKLGTVATADFCRRQFESDIRQAGPVNRDLLQQILSLNQDTEYGKHYRFDQIAKPGAYKQEIPFTTYKDYLPYIDRIAAGATNILTTEPVTCFGLTSGVTGKQKMIPMTARSSQAMSMHMGPLSKGILFRAIPASRSLCQGLNIVNANQATTSQGIIPTETGIFSGVWPPSRITPYLWTSPPEARELDHQRNANYLHLLFALKERKLMYISSPLSSAMVNLFHLLEQEWPRLVQDLAAGQITIDSNLDPKIRQRLERKLGRNPKRAQELTVEFNQGIDGIAQRIWPRILYVNCISGSSFSIYARQLRQYIGLLPIYSGLYGATEALVGISTHPGDFTYVVTPRTAYHEFIPLNQVNEKQPQALDLDKLGKGECYEVVVTNLAGFYRYRLGDIVRVIGYRHGSPVLEFLYRRGHMVNLVGEKTSEETVCNTVYKVMQQRGTELVDFTTVVDYETYPCRYTFYVEANNIDRGEVDRGEMSLEDALCHTNPRYRSIRQTDRLGQSALQIVRPGTFEKLKKALIARGTSASQVKIPRVIKDQRLASLLTANVSRG